MVIDLINCKIIFFDVVFIIIFKYLWVFLLFFNCLYIELFFAGVFKEVEL